jgi:hypothetical protein
MWGGSTRTRRDCCCSQTTVCSPLPLPDRADMRLTYLPLHEPPHACIHGCVLLSSSGYLTYQLMRYLCTCLSAIVSVSSAVPCAARCFSCAFNIGRVCVRLCLFVQSCAAREGVHLWRGRAALSRAAARAADGACAACRLVRVIRVIEPPHRPPSPAAPDDLLIRKMED